MTPNPTPTPLPDDARARETCTLELARRAVERHEARCAQAGIESERDGIHYVGAIPLDAAELAEDLDALSILARALIETADKLEKAEKEVQALRAEKLRMMTAGPLGAILKASAPLTDLQVAQMQAQHADALATRQRPDDARNAR